MSKRSWNRPVLTRRQTTIGALSDTYRQALTVAPADPEIFKRLGVLYQTELKFAESIDLFRRGLVALEPVS